MIPGRFFCLTRTSVLLYISYLWALAARTPFYEVYAPL